ncbi:glutathione S-transferase family protein [Hydromonas duriensis]|uniref:Glutathione S-transferase n=1 Tax=Hydromonas duriensis TaxID=1527608 RepID=A0A4R6YAL1_9BURK|nr:glutathione S-transferase [Hydromonas duriensis]TDR32544.1 glutathione S-transferase [Hydromonas duriensis]
MLKIYGKASSINVRKVLWTCAELNLNYTREDYGTGFAPTTTPEFLSMNPNGMVPVIRDEELVLWESNTICRYLVHRHKRFDLLPIDAEQKARVEQWMDWQATELNNSWRYAFMSLARQHVDYQDEQKTNAGVALWNSQMSILNQQLARTGAFVTGQAFTLADVVLGLSVNRWVMTPMAHADLPFVMGYYERLSQRPAFMVHGRNGLV